MSIMPRKRGVTRRDFPALCLLYGAICTFGAIALPLANHSDFATQAQLTSVTGIIQKIHSTTGKIQHLDFYVLASDGAHHLTQQDMSNKFPALQDLHIGDTITARVRHDTIGRDLDWYWELQRNGELILSYDQTKQFFSEMSEKDAVTVHWLTVLAAVLFVCSGLLRWHFGAWTERQAQREKLPPTSAA